MNRRKINNTLSTGFSLNVELKKINLLPPVNIALTLIFLLLSTLASATDYYISSSGNDLNNNGLSPSTPWKTITKVNSAFSNLKPGDRILFNRGDTFYGTLIISKSGSSVSPITIGAYGTGDNPIITGFTTVTAWTNLGNNIWESTNAVSALSTCNMVVINGVNTPMGRYPNTGYLTYQSHSGNTSITSSSLSGTPNWTGAEVVVRTNQWTLDRSPITQQIGGTLTFTKALSKTPTNGFGFFIQNDIRTLDQQNEWYFNPSTKKISICSLNEPSNVKIPSNEILTLVHGNYITINNIIFRGSNSYTFFNDWSQNNLIIDNSTIEYSGINGVNLTNSQYFTIQNSTISNSNNIGINLPDSDPHASIINNLIQYTGIIPGMGLAGFSGYSGILSVYDGFRLKVEYNTIQNTGYMGINFMGDSVSIKNNLIDNFCITVQDGGGIYTQASDEGRIIDANIILNGIGNYEGTNDVELYAHGIYIDDGGENVEITNNTIANISTAGLYLNGASNIVIDGNTIYNTKGQGFGKGSISLSRNSSTQIKNLSIHNNIFFAKSSTQQCLFYYSYDDTYFFGALDNNYYERPIKDDNSIHIRSTLHPYPGVYTDLKGWKTLSGQDLQSYKSPTAITDTSDIIFYYNETKVNKTIALAKPMLDAKCIKYVNSISLLPFTSLVLFVDPNPAQLSIPVYVSSAVGNTTPSLLEMTYNMSLANIVPAASAFTVQVNSVARSVNSVAISGTKVQLTLASAIAFGDVVTVAYTKPAVSPIQTTSAGQAASVSAQAVTNNVNAPSPGYVSSAVENASPSLLEMTYNLSLANTVPAVSAFSVLVNSLARMFNYVTISGTKVQLTLASPVAYGDIVTVAYTKPSSNQIQTTSAGQAASFNAQTVTNNCLKIVGKNDLLGLLVDTKKKKIRIYPNPAHDFFIISFDDPIVEPQNLKIMDLSGKIVLTEFIEQGIQNIQIPVNFKSGNYIVALESNSKIHFTQKLIIHQLL